MTVPHNAINVPATGIAAVNASILRHRAGVLRELAGTIERTAAMSLDRDAGADTWIGARPLLCHNVLVTNLMQIHGAVDDLRWRAWQLERQADEIDAAGPLHQSPATGTW